jgi:hypothetical protein
MNLRTANVRRRRRESDRAKHLWFKLADYDGAGTARLYTEYRRGRPKKALTFHSFKDGRLTLRWI